MSTYGRKQRKVSPLNEVVSAKEAAEILGISRRHVTRLIKAGHLDGRKLERDWIITRSSVLAYKAQKEGKPPKGQK